MASAKSGRATLEQVARQASKRKAGALSPCPSVSRPSKKAKGPLVQPIPAGERDISSNCTVVYQPGAVEHADGSFKYLQEHVAWLRKEITVMGRKVMQPREIAYMADHGLRYTYSKTQLEPTEFPEEIEAIRKRVQEMANTNFNCCLLNRYRDGRDHLGWHSDNEKLFGKNPTIASVSFGAKRDFVLRRNADHAHKLVYPLGHGDILIMRGSTQQDWMHSLPKRASSGPRINMTFRNIIHPEAVRM